MVTMQIARHKRGVLVLRVLNLTPSYEPVLRHYLVWCAGDITEIPQTPYEY